MGVLSQRRERVEVISIEVVHGDSLSGGTFDTILRGDAGPSAAGDAPPKLTLAPPIAPLEGFQSTTLPTLSGSTAGALLAGGGSGGNGAGGVGTGPGGGGIGFFNSRAEGTSFVFIVDSSGSMTDQGRFGRATAELKRSLSKLKAYQKFYVIFFNSETFPMFYPRPASELLPATTANRQRAVSWINNQKPSSLTDPRRAVELALELKPDAIFLLTDGEFHPEVPALIRYLNKDGVVIHTIAFEGREGEAMLEAIARQNKGTYRYVK